MVSVFIVLLAALTVIVFYFSYRAGYEDSYSFESRSASSSPCPSAGDQALLIVPQPHSMTAELCDDEEIDQQNAVSGIKRKPKRTSNRTSNLLSKKALGCAHLAKGPPKVSVLPLSNEKQDISLPSYDPSHGGRVGNMKGQGPGGHTSIVSVSSYEVEGGRDGDKTHHQCKTIVQQYASQCLAIAFADVEKVDQKQMQKQPQGTAPRKQTPGIPVVRFDETVDINGLVIDGTNDNIAVRADAGTLEEQQSKGIGKLELNEGHNPPAGHFRRVPKERGFQRVQEKLAPFLNSIESIRATLNTKLKWRGIEKGSDLVVMVVNEGETDLFMNFACSCRIHGISLHNVLIFAGSKEVVPMVEAAEAIGVYHSAFAAVAKKASTDYLDRVFVDMMWYKAFSTYLVLSTGMNILFQDVDLVWFRDPFPYFKAFLDNEKKSIEEGKSLAGFPVEAFFSDDGQRSKRYSPYFFNSGFYYMKATPRSVYFTWSIMTDFDAVQVTGSHQNVFTLRLVESLGLGAAYTQILKLYEFPNGILYHHDKKYMDRMNHNQEDPYHFHMCWTQGKPQKLDYLRLAKMWYLQEQCSALPDLIFPRGQVYKELKNKDRGYKRSPHEWTGNNVKETEALRHMSNFCCKSTGLNKRELSPEKWKMA